MVLTLISIDAFGPYIKSVRKAKGLTQGDLAKRVGCQTDYIVQLEKGNRIAFWRVEAIIKALGIHVNYAISVDENDFKRLMEMQDGN